MATMTFTRQVPYTENLTGEFLKDSDGNIYFISVERDEDPLNPRDDGNIAHMICFHRRYNLGDKHDFEDLNSLVEQLERDKINGDDYVSSPLFLMDHSGLSISIHDFHDCWDSGLVGIVYVKKSELISNGIDIKDDWEAEARKIISAEVSLYDQYLSGDVYGFRLFKLCNNEWEEVDSCWGFYGSDIRENGMLDQLSSDMEVLNCESEKDL